MNKKQEFTVDFNKLHEKLTKKAYKLDAVRDQLETVAFDVVRFKSDDNRANLWQIQNADDGDYIVAIYEDKSEQEKTSKWDVVLSKTAKTINVFYNNEQLVSINAAKLGIPDSELPLIEKYLPTKLATNKKLVQSLLKELPYQTKQAVVKKYPELGE